MSPPTKQTCCLQGHSRHKITQTRDSITGQFTYHPIHQNDIPEQCGLCKGGTHHKCYKPFDCGCDCADLIEETNL